MAVGLCFEGGGREGGREARGEEGEYGRNVLGAVVGRKIPACTNTVNDNGSRM